ncbi:hypothetical protein [Lentibacillus saliphilus]|uniref:hypothetical protein n=1 Tax=Lentibacillus saliphilus TaxID=2737028 RepID=UPI001C2F135E|nr:hypothetical protein [Lentibacillus saliphilus]
MKKVKGSSLFTCRSCSIDTDDESGRKKKWYSNICIGQVAMFGALVYILISELMR